MWAEGWPCLTAQETLSKEGMRRAAFTVFGASGDEGGARRMNLKTQCPSHWLSAACTVTTATSLLDLQPSVFLQHQWLGN